MSKKPLIKSRKPVQNKPNVVHKDKSKYDRKDFELEDDFMDDYLDDLEFLETIDDILKIEEE